MIAAVLIALFAPLPFLKETETLALGWYKIGEGPTCYKLKLMKNKEYRLWSINNTPIYRGEWAWDGHRLDLFRNKLNGDGPLEGKKVGWLSSMCLFLRYDKKSKFWKGWGYDDTHWPDRRLQYHLKYYGYKEPENDPQ